MITLAWKYVQFWWLLGVSVILRDSFEVEKHMIAHFEALKKTDKPSQKKFEADFGLEFAFVPVPK